MHWTGGTAWPLARRSTKALAPPPLEGSGGSCAEATVWVGQLMTILDTALGR
jgi:hypothetical protein